jgi:hypothetical protein
MTSSEHGERATDFDGEYSSLWYNRYIDKWSAEETVQEARWQARVVNHEIRCVKEIQATMVWRWPTTEK